jgi:ribosomal protein L11 methyltransferase
MQWLEVTITTSAVSAEAVGDILLALRSGGLAEEPRRGGLVRLRGYLPAGPAAAEALEAIAARVRALAAAGLDPGPGTIDVRAIDDEDWAHAWKAHFRPFAVGRLWIAPTWDRTAPPAGAAVVAIDPGMAFGTGLHPSTRLCLIALDARLRGGEVVVDVGTGSGILAIAAAQLGARRVLARDTDPLAVRIARANVAHNGVAERVAVDEGAFLEGVLDRADAVVANLTADAHLRFLGAARAALAPHGWLAASGIVAPRLREVRSAAAAAGLAATETLADGEWRCLILQAAP